MGNVARLALLGLALLAGCCASGACDAEQLPRRGQVESGQQLFELYQHLARHECSDEAYARLSQRTRKAVSSLEWWAGWDSIRVGEPWGYRIVDVVSRGSFVASYPLRPGRELVFVSYQERPRPELLAQLLVVTDEEQGRRVLRLGVQEQLDEHIPFNQLPAPAGDGGKGPGK